MALTPQQTSGIDVLNKKIATGYKPTAQDTINLNYAKKNGYGSTPNVKPATGTTPMITGYKDGVAVQVPKGQYVPGVSLTPPTKVNASTLTSTDNIDNITEEKIKNQTLAQQQETAGVNASIDTYSTQLNDLIKTIKDSGALSQTYTPEQQAQNKTDLLAKQGQIRDLGLQTTKAQSNVDFNPNLLTSQGSMSKQQIEREASFKQTALSNEEANLLSSVNLSAQEQQNIISGTSTISQYQDKIQTHIDSAKADVLAQAKQLTTDQQNKLAIALDAYKGIDVDKLTAEQTATFSKLVTDAGLDPQLVFQGIKAVNQQQALENATKNKPDIQVIGEHYDENVGAMVKDYGYVDATGKITNVNGTPYTVNTTPTTPTGTDSISAFKSSITTQESGNYSAVNKDSGALGAYQFMPTTGLPLVGLNPNNKADIQKFLNTPALQDQAFEKFVGNLSAKYGGDTTKMAAAYYGGDGAAQIVGTPAANKRQGANGEYPSINEYVKSVGDRMNKITGATNTNEVPDQYKEALEGRTPAQIQNFNNLKEVDKGDVSMLITGDVLIDDLLKSRGASGNAARQALINKARTVDPNFSVTENKQRVTFKTQWNNINGGSSKQIVSANTSLGHIATLKTLVDKLQNTDFMKANSIKQAVAKNINGPQASVVSQVDQTIELMAHELASFYAGGTAPDVQSIQNQRDILNATAPKDIINALINNQTELLGSKVSQMARQYNKVMGSYPSDSVLDPEVLAKLKSAGVNTSALEDEYYKQQNYTVGQTYTVYGKQVKYNGNGDFSPVQ